MHITGWVVVVTLVTGLGIADALPGTNTVDSGDIINGQVTSADIKNHTIKARDLRSESVTGGKIRNGTVASVDVADGSLRGRDVANGSLTGADIANNSSLGAAEINEAGLAFGCSQKGLANAWIYVDGNATFPGSNWTTSNIPARFNCHNDAVAATQVKRISTGVFEVYFEGLQGYITIGTVDYDGGAACSRSNLTVNYRGSNIWRVEISEPTGSGPVMQNCDFSLVQF